MIILLDNLFDYGYIADKNTLLLNRGKSQVFIYAVVLRIIVFYFYFWPCSRACGILVPCLGIEFTPPAVEGMHALTTGPPGRPLPLQFIQHIQLIQRKMFSVFLI